MGIAKSSTRVESLLEQEDKANTFIEASALQIAAKTLAAEKSVESLIGRDFGHYRILAPLDSGGMGDVYRGRYPPQPNRRHQKFDLQQLELQGEPSTVAEEVQTNPGPAIAAFALSDNGLLAFRSGGSIANRQLLLTDRAGARLGLAGTPAPFQNPVFSGDGQSIAVSLQNPGRDIWIMNVASGALTRFTLNPADEDYPVWSAGTIVFSSNREGGVSNLYAKPSNGGGAEELLVKTDFPNVPHNETQAQFSPDGHWMAYVSDPSGRPEVYIRSFPSGGVEFQVSTDRGLQPRWREDGKELFFLGSEGTEDFMAVDVASNTSKPVLRVGSPRKLFQSDVISQNQRNSYDVLGGQRFVLNLIPRVAGTAPIVTFNLNWQKKS